MKFTFKFKFKFKLDFFRTNPIMSAMVGITLLISIILAYMIYAENSALSDTSKKLDELKNKIRILNSTSPYPSEKNLEYIRDDIKILKFNIFKLEDIFGNVYAKPLLAFVQSLTKEDIKSLETELEVLQKEDTSSSRQNQQDIETRLDLLRNMPDSNLVYDFITSWKNYIDEEKKAKQELSVGDIFTNFRKYKKYSQEGFDQARNVFLTEFQKETFEPLNNDTIDDYILASLGIPLDFSRIRCKNIVSDIELGLNQVLIKNNVVIRGNKLNLFTEFASVPNDDEIPYIINYCRFLEDFFQRVAQSGIERIESYKKLNGLKGFEDSNFLIFQYQIDVVTSLDSLRAFLNNLQEAYKDNRIYVVESLNISVMEDNANNLQPLESQDNIPKILIGNSDTIKASITVNYLIFKKKIL